MKSLDELKEIFGLDSIWEEDWPVYRKSYYEQKEVKDNTSNIIRCMFNI